MNKFHNAFGTKGKKIVKKMRKKNINLLVMFHLKLLKDLCKNYQWIILPALLLYFKIKVNYYYLQNLNFQKLHKNNTLKLDLNHHLNKIIYKTKTGLIIQ